MCSDESPVGAKGKQTTTMASCQPPPPPDTHHMYCLHTVSHLLLSI